MKRIRKIVVLLICFCPIIFEISFAMQCMSGTIEGTKLVRCPNEAVEGGTLCSEHDEERKRILDSTYDAAMEAQKTSDTIETATGICYSCKATNKQLSFYEGIYLCQSCKNDFLAGLNTQTTDELKNNAVKCDVCTSIVNKTYNTNVTNLCANHKDYLTKRNSNGCYACGENSSLVWQALCSEHWKLYETYGSDAIHEAVISLKDINGNFDDTKDLENVIKDIDVIRENNSSNSMNRTSQPLNYEKLPNPLNFLKGVSNKATIEETADKALTPIATFIYALLLKIGIAISLVVLTIYGFMWITATPQKRADLKQSIAPIATGLVILIAGIAPAAQIVDLVNNLFTQQANVPSLIDNTAGAIAGLVQTIGISVALIILLSTGIQFITASPNKRVEIRGKIFNIIIGVAIIILTSTILNVVISQIYSMK